MALYDRSKTTGFYTAIAHDQNVCHYCERAIVKRRENKEISHDEMIFEMKKLKGKLTGKRVMKFTYVGHEFCVCPECLEKVSLEIENSLNKKKTSTEQEPTQETTQKTTETSDIPKEDKTEKANNNNKGKGKANASASK